LQKDSPNKGRKNIKKILSEKKLDAKSKEAITIERDRRKRIEERQKLYNERFEVRKISPSYEY
jgi:transcriptional regulator ATRX